MTMTDAIIAGLAVTIPLAMGLVIWRLMPRAPRLAELEALNAQLRDTLAEKSAAEQALARSETQFRADFEWAAVGKVHYDPVTGRIIRANKAHAAMLGYEPEELVGRLGSEFTYPDDKDRGPYAKLVDGQIGNYAREKRYLRRDGTPVWGRVSASVVRSPEAGEPFLAVAVIEDIDDRMKALMALEAAKLDLERVVEERTAALAQRDVLLREVYHRVRNNLQVIDSLLVMQARRLADPEAGAALESLRSRVYALGLVHGQLMGSKDLETFDIAPFLEELSRYLLDGGGERGISLTVRAAPLRVGLDFAIPLGLLVTELVSNAMRHTFAEGRGAIEVALDEDEPGRLVLSVGDDGVGEALSPEAARSLGATIIDGLVRQLRGELSISTGAGTRATVRLPAPVAA